MCRERTHCPANAASSISPTSSNRSSTTSAASSGTPACAQRLRQLLPGAGPLGEQAQADLPRDRDRVGLGLGRSAPGSAAEPAGARRLRGRSGSGPSAARRDSVGGLSRSAASGGRAPTALRRTGALRASPAPIEADAPCRQPVAPRRWLVRLGDAGRRPRRTRGRRPDRATGGAGRRPVRGRRGRARRRSTTAAALARRTRSAVDSATRCDRGLPGRRRSAGARPGRATTARRAGRRRGLGRAGAVRVARRHRSEVDRRGQRLDLGVELTAPMPSFSLIRFSISAATSGFSRRNLRAFSLPWPSWSPS